MGDISRRVHVRLAAALALALVAAMSACATPASAQTLSPATATVTDFAAVTLDGTVRTTTATMSDFSVTAGAGWHVTVQATPFAEVNELGQYVTGGKSVPAGSLSMAAPTVTPSDLVTVTPGPYTIDGATVQIASAASGATGTCSFTQGGPITLTLPARVYAGAYRSTVTVAVASGP